MDYRELIDACEYDAAERQMRINAYRANSSGSVGDINLQFPTRPAAFASFTCEKCGMAFDGHGAPVSCPWCRSRLVRPIN